MNKKLKTLLAASFLIAGIAAQACTLAAWDNTTGTAVPGGPADANIIPRYSGLCSMEVTTTGSVINNGTGPTGNGTGAAVSGPAGEAAMITRFYFKASGPAGSSATLFETYDGEVPGAAGVNPVYTVTYDGTNVTVTPAGGTAAVAPVSATKQWHSVEVKWAAGNGTTGGAIDVWVDTDAKTVAADASTTSAVAATSIQAVQLGGITNSGFTQILIDDYESRRSTSIGRLLRGDANADTGVDGADAILILRESIGITINSGYPDVNEDGFVDGADALLALRISIGL